MKCSSFSDTTTTVLVMVVLLFVVDGGWWVVVVVVVKYACFLFLSVCSSDTCLFRPDSGYIIHINILTFVKS